MWGVQLNPYNFRQYLAKAPSQPHLNAWVITAALLAFLAWWTVPYMAPKAVALDLPKNKTFGLKTPPSAFVVYSGNGYIYNNRFYNFGDLTKALGGLDKRQSLLIAATAGTTLQDLLPLLSHAEAMGFENVAFTIKQ